MPAQVVGVYTKALLDSGMQVTLFNRDFYDRLLKHLPLQKLDNLEIWELGLRSFLTTVIYPPVNVWPRLWGTLKLLIPYPLYAYAPQNQSEQLREDCFYLPSGIL